jgi:hypothetical protein
MEGELGRACQITEFYLENIKGRDHLGKIDVKMGLKEVMVLWTAFSSLCTGTSGRLL